MATRKKYTMPMMKTLGLIKESIDLFIMIFLELFQFADVSSKRPKKASKRLCIIKKRILQLLSRRYEVLAGLERSINVALKCQFR